MNQGLGHRSEAGRGPLVQQLRLWTGLVLFAYVLFHYVNHALGHLSLGAMEAMLDIQEGVVGSLPGQILLYGALLIHSALGLWRLVSVRTWRRPGWEWAQIAFGLAIPWFLVVHIVATRGTQSLLGIGLDYRQELFNLWQPGVALEQSILLLVVWIHACIGLHFWLRIRDWYAGAFPYLSGLAVLVPSLALTGWISAARRLRDTLELEAVRSDAARQALDELIATNRFINANLGGLAAAGQWLMLALVAGFVLAMAVRWYLQRFGRRIKVSYGEGIVASCAPGHTLLEISRAWGVPHMSVCGGRARCSTCRTLVLSGAENLSPQTEAESALLRKINAGPEIRLACQCRVSGDVSVRPMIRPRQGDVSPRHADPIGWGVERDLAVFFLDVRGFSRISEKSLPYDVVFILNSLFDEVGTAIEHASGYIDKFMGDGVMALFGIAGGPQPACRQALVAALDAHQAAERASTRLREHLREPMRVGIGIHFGQVVVGRVGKTSDQVAPSRLTAIGDTVNVAARLEAATKEMGVGLVVSSVVFETAGIDIRESFGTRTEITVRNISEPVDVVAVSDLQTLRATLSETAEPPPSPPGFGIFPGRRAKSPRRSGGKKSVILRR